MQKIYIVTQESHSDNSEQYSEYEASGSTQVDTVGTFFTREAAEEAKDLVDSWGNEARGYSSQVIDNGSLDNPQSYERNFEWWTYYSTCKIEEVVIGNILIQQPAAEHVAYATIQRLKREEEAAAYKRKQEKEQELCVFFNDHGADRHLDFLGLYLVRAGCKTLEDVTNMGANEFIKLQGYDSSRLVNDSTKQQGLRDFQQAIQRKDFKMSANHARHRQPGGWAAGPVEGYEETTSYAQSRVLDNLPF